MNTPTFVFGKFNFLWFIVLIFFKQEVLDFESWSFSISDANRNPQFLPNWQKLYSFKEAYGLKDLSPPSIAELVQRMTEKESLTQDYYRFF